MKVLSLQSIRGKLTLLIAVASGIALTFACAAFVMNYIVAMRDSKVQTLTALGEVLASNSTAALSFQQAAAAEDLLASLKNRPTIAFACVMDMDGGVLADYEHQDEPPELPNPSASKEHFYDKDGHLGIVVPVIEDGEQLGAVFLHATMADVQEQISHFIGIALVVIAACLGVAILLAYTLQGLISAPILSLANTADRISREGDYSIRVERKSNDELGVLYEHFNHMLQRIQDGETMLREARDELELRVEQRTHQLRDANLELEQRIEQRHQAIRELEKTSKIVQLLQEVTVAANEAEQVESAVVKTLNSFCQFANWPGGHAYLPRPDAPDEFVATDLWYVKDDHELEALCDWFAGKHVSKGEGLAGLVVDTVSPAWSEGLADDFLKAFSATPLGDSISAFAFPVLAGEKLVAVLEFFFLEQPSEDEQALAELHSHLNEIAVHVGSQLGRVFEREAAAVNLEQMHRKVLDTARQAGMAEVATGVLHNVGNVLNSVNVSCGIIDDKLRKSSVNHLKKATQMIEQHLDDLGPFITQDEQGRHLAPFLIKLSEKLASDEQNMLKEVASLSKNIDHIKDIISVQQANAKISGFTQDIAPLELMEDAVKVNLGSMAKHHIKIVKEFEEVPIAPVDRQKILQILINLISNSKHALKDSDQPDKRITLRLYRVEDNRLRFEVEDNGIGISEENRTRVFSHGFTTKKNGHGFGLHGAALFAEEMGGSLTLHSEGTGKGARFTLELPVKFIKPIQEAATTA